MTSRNEPKSNELNCQFVRSVQSVQRKWTDISVQFNSVQFSSVQFSSVALFIEF